MSEQNHSNFIGPLRNPWYPYQCTCTQPKSFHWCPSGRSFVNYHKWEPSWGNNYFDQWTERSFKPYKEMEDGSLRPDNGRKYRMWFSMSKGFYPMEDRMTEWKHDVPVGTMKLWMLLSKRYIQMSKVLYHPDGKVAKDLKRKWDQMNENEGHE